jgi:hypothetical protein
MVEVHSSDEGSGFFVPHEDVRRCSICMGGRWKDEIACNQCMYLMDAFGIEPRALLKIDREMRAKWQRGKQAAALAPRDGSDALLVRSTRALGVMLLDVANPDWPGLAAVPPMALRIETPYGFQLFTKAPPDTRQGSIIVADAGVDIRMGNSWFIDWAVKAEEIWRGASGLPKEALQ